VRHTIYDLLKILGFGFGATQSQSGGDDEVLNSLIIISSRQMESQSEHQHDLLDQSTAHFQLLNNAHSYLLPMADSLELELFERK
jgi:hypothetical protein